MSFQGKMREDKNERRVVILTPRNIKDSVIFLDFSCLLSQFQINLLQSMTNPFSIYLSKS
jgi:hypothetical protein